MLATATLTQKPEVIAPFKPLPWQYAPWRDKGLVMLLTGSAGGGKSRLAAEKIHGYCLKYPGATWLMLRKAREWTGRSIVPFYNQTVVGRDPRVRFNKSEGAFYYDNGSVVYSGGMKDESQQEAIRSIGGEGGLDGAWFEEANAFTRGDFEEILGRLRHTAADWQQLILTTNPGGSKHWIARDLIKGGGASVYTSGAVMNPHNSPSYLSTLELLTGVKRERLVLGRWVTAEGAVYDTFDPAVHVKSRPKSEMVRWMLCQDEGYTNPATILLVGEDSDGRWHVFREYYERGKLQAAVVETAKSWSDEFRPAVDAVDAAAAGLIADLRDADVPAKPSKGRVLDGIQAVQDMLAVQGDNLPRLTIEPTCENLINEFESYVWKPEKDEPVKENDHALDALRYLAVLMGRYIQTEITDNTFYD